MYDTKEWRLFIDKSKASLKCVLLHNGNRYASVPIGYSLHLKETYENTKILITKIKYFDHNWLIYGDIKVMCMLLGQQGGYTKYPCFLCLWDSRAKTKHSEQEQWLLRMFFSLQVLILLSLDVFRKEFEPGVNSPGSNSFRKTFLIKH